MAESMQMAEIREVLCTVVKFLRSDDGQNILRIVEAFLCMG